MASKWWEEEPVDLDPQAHLDRAEVLLDQAAPVPGELISKSMAPMMLAMRHAILGCVKIGAEMERLRAELDEELNKLRRG